MSNTACPECAAEIVFEDGTQVGEILVCPDCGVDFEVTGTNPATIKLAPMEQEDWGE